MLIILALLSVPLDQLQEKMEETRLIQEEEASILHLEGILTSAQVPEEEIIKTLSARRAALAERQAALCIFHDVEVTLPAEKEEVAVKPKRQRRAPAASAPAVAEGAEDTGWKVLSLDADLYPAGSWMADLRAAVMVAKQYKPEFQPVLDQLVQASKNDPSGFFPVGLIAQRYSVGNKTQLITGALNTGLATVDLASYKFSKEEKGGRKLVRLDYATLSALKA